MSGRYDIAQRVKEILEASDPLNYGAGQQAGAIDLSPPPQLSPAPNLSAPATPTVADYAPPTAPVPSAYTYTSHAAPVVPPPPTPPPPPQTPPPPPARVLAPPPPARPSSASPTAAPPSLARVGQPELAELAALLRDGRKIMAVKRYRELTGVGLADAKAAVEALELRLDDLDLTAPPPAPRASQPPAPFAAPAAPPMDVPEWLQPVVAEVRRGNKIGAIKAYRAATGVGLSEAKDTVEGLERQLAAPAAPPVPAPARRGPAPDMDLLAEEVVRLVQQGQKVAAITRYREVTNCGLREAKEAVDTIEERLNAWPR